FYYFLYFPTRRSSDLDGQHVLKVGNDIALIDLASGRTVKSFARDSREKIARAALSPDGRYLLTAGPIEYIPGKPIAARLWELERDRKSTRLNSSHGSI